MAKQLIRLIMTTDTHGHWLNRPDKAELSLLNTSSAIKALKAKDSDLTITIDLGDFIQGSSFATYLSQERKDGSVFARAMNYIGYDYQLIGNHEFNFGPDYRNHILDQIQAQILVSNIVKADTGEIFKGKAYDILDFQGFKIGLIGTTTSYIPHWELPENYQGLAFIDAFEATKKYVDMIRPQVDLLIVCYHGGFERDLNSGEPTEELTLENQGYQMLAGIEGIDILLTGHQHRLINQAALGAWVMQAGSVGDYVGEVEVLIEDQQITSISGQLHLTEVYPPDSELKEILEPEFSEASHWLNDIIGQAPLDSPWDHSLKARAFGHPFIELLNQIQLEETGADFSAVTLVNPLFANFTGDITQEILLKSYPFYNLIAKCQMTGQDLYEIMEFNLEYYCLDQAGLLTVNPDYCDPKPRHYNLDLYSGLQTTIDMTKDPGQRVVSLVDERTGQEINRDSSYSLAVSQYRAVGGGDFKWFKPNKILSMSQDDIASLLFKAVQTYPADKWDYINHNYQHNIWQPAVELANFPNV